MPTCYLSAFCFIALLNMATMARSVLSFGIGTYVSRSYVGFEVS